MKAGIRLRRTLWTGLFGVLFLLTVFAWWNSSRYSERHLIYIGPGTVEFFSSSSLLRISLVPGKVGHLGSKTYYRQKNARGKMLFRPAFPQFHNRSGLWEITMGYWHIAALTLICLGTIASVEISASRHSRAGAEGRN